MPITVAEYLGVRTDLNHPILPIRVGKNTGADNKPVVPCPFKNSHCEKAKRGDKPVCSIRDTATNQLWIVCPSRLCATMKGTSKNPIALNEHQKLVLHMVAKEIYGEQIAREEVLVDREVAIPITNTSEYSADYIMWRSAPNLSGHIVQDRPVVLEMQGGGETTSTGDLTKHISEWELGRAELTTPVHKTAPLVTNAWRRQQEQFLVKGNTAMLTGGRIVFCIGSLIYDYLMPRLTSTTIFPSLKNANWTLALITIKEGTISTSDRRPNCAPHSLPLTIDKEKTLFTNYGFFVQAITNQGSACEAMFNRNYINLS